MYQQKEDCALGYAEVGGRCLQSKAHPCEWILVLANVSSVQPSKLGVELAPQLCGTLLSGLLRTFKICGKVWDKITREYMRVAPSFLRNYAPLSWLHKAL
jgi:hypothetical protein